VTHTLKPVYDKKSKNMILGTIPSVKSENTDFITLTLKIVFGAVHI
jgi:hypothetical protein